jgi:hypothetical protein
VSKFVKIRGYFSKTKGVCQQNYLGNTELVVAKGTYVAQNWDTWSAVLKTVMNLPVP